MERLGTHRELLTRPVSRRLLMTAVPAIPGTRTGNETELAGAPVSHGEPVAGPASLADPAVLDHDRDLLALRR